MYQNSGESAKLQQLLEETATQSATLAFSAATSWQTETEKQIESVNLPSGLNLLGDFNVYGKTQLADIIVNGQATIVGTSPSDPTLSLTLTLSQDSISVLGGTLKLAGSEGVDIMNGALMVDATGDVQVRGNLTVGGTLKASRFSPNDNGDLVFDLNNESGIMNNGSDPLIPNSKFGILLVKGVQGDIVASVDASGSAEFKQLTTPRLVIASAQKEATESASVVLGETTSNATAGKATLQAGFAELKINNPNVTENTLVYVTPVSSTSNKVLYVKSKAAQEVLPDGTEQQGYFTVAVDSPVWTDIEFNWWIIELQP
ncbi:MAG: hypothetical protein HYS83_00725 [Candidatus Blackburnbacteria bacterium]|nr:hypothetical protein [Candidatus Blackburnbacteria bacterium]